MVTILLGNGFEEVEALTPCDVLRRGGVEVRLAGIGGKAVTGGHGITVMADCAAEELDDCGEMLVLPGGLGGVASIRGSKAAMQTVERAWQSGRFVAAICAAPTLLAELGITDGKTVTCYPGMETQMGDAHCTGLPAVRDGRLICGRSAGTATEFSLALLEALRGREAAERVCEAIHFEGEYHG